MSSQILNSSYPVCNFGEHATCVSYVMRNPPKAVQFTTGCLPSCTQNEKQIDKILVRGRFYDIGKGEE